MARRIAVVSIVCMMLLSMATANAGRKLLQSSKSPDFRGRDTAAISSTQASIDQAASGNKGPVQAANPRPAQTPPKTVEGTSNQGLPQAQQSQTAANINKYASGNKPTPKPAPKASDVTTAIANAPKKGGNTGVDGSGRAQNSQSTTAAGIANAIARQENTAAGNAQQGPNRPQNRN